MEPNQERSSEICVTEAKIPRHHIHVEKDIYTQEEWTFMEGKIRPKGSQSSSTKVIIQKFKGPRAKQLWQKTLRCNWPLMINQESPSLTNNGNIAQVRSGVTSLLHNCERNTPSSLLAPFLKEGDHQKVIMLGTQIVHGIVSGLGHLFENFPDLSIKSKGKTVLSFTPDITALEGGGIGRRETSRNPDVMYGRLKVRPADPNYRLCTKLINKVVKFLFLEEKADSACCMTSLSTM
ncbi:hypothetical protein GGU11DRAFT_757740 [Lentinula aff. detonsa]|nr:hypothetical protein GGU11DRAFT_757740 [Lentinula aff. detonsa]